MRIPGRYVKGKKQADKEARGSGYVVYMDFQSLRLSEHLRIPI